MFRPWDSIEDLERPVVLSSSGCASGCASDHCPPANSAPFSLTPTLPRHCKPGYTHLKSNTMPHIRSVSGTILWPLVSLQNEKSQIKKYFSQAFIWQLNLMWQRNDNKWEFKVICFHWFYLHVVIAIIAKAVWSNQFWNCRIFYSRKYFITSFTVSNLNPFYASRRKREKIFSQMNCSVKEH